MEKEERIFLMTPKKHKLKENANYFDNKMKNICIDESP